MQAARESAVADIELDEHYAAFIAREVAEGRYASASDVVREGLRLLEERGRDAVEDDAWLARAVAEALDDPRAPLTEHEVFERLERRFAADIAHRRNGA